MCRFIDYFVDNLAEEQAWEFWLHKETGKTWGDFRLTVIPQEIDMEELVNNALNIQRILEEGG